MGIATLYRKIKKYVFNNSYFLILR
ncbi:hypothetical protein PS027_23810 [Shigella sonnei]|nr:hypothetical protein [Shigella sonnei]